MVGKPIISIKNFTGASEKGCYYLEGFKPVYHGGNSMLQQCYGMTSVVTEDTALYSGMSEALSMCDFSVNQDAYINFCCTNNDIFSFTIGAGDNLGKIHTNGQTASASPGMLMTKNGHLLYATAGYLGVGFLGKVKTGSSSTKIVDSVNANLGALGATNGVKFFNLTKKEENTITSVSTTTSTNDTINFTAGTTTPATNDYYMMFNDTRFAFNNTVQFLGQKTSSEWVRQIVFWNDAFYVLNGNYLAKLAKDDSTWTTDVLEEYHKQLPDSTQAECFAYNQDKLIIGGSYQRKGRLLLWDGYASGWVNSIETELPVVAVYPSGGGWVYLSGDTFFYTDGYSTKIITKILNYTRGIFTGFKYNSFLVADNKIYFNGGSGTYGRGKSGLWVYDMTIGGWSFSPHYNGIGYNISSGIVHESADSTESLIYASSTSTGTSVYNINKVSKRSSIKSSALFLIKLPGKMKINLIELSVSPTADEPNSISSQNVSVLYGDGNKVLYKQVNAGSGSTAIMIKNGSGATSPAYVGQAIMVLNGDFGWKRSYITGIGSGGTSSEGWDIYPALDSNILTNLTSASIERKNLRLAGTKSVSNHDCSPELTYNVDTFYSDKLFVEVYFEGTSSAANLNLLGINIY